MTRTFMLVKFRTMRPNTASVASHLADVSAITPFAFLRQTKLDELPQLWKVFKGEMTLVGPRPCLFSQKASIGERELFGILSARPGITGLTKTNKIDISTPGQLAETDGRMLKVRSASTCFKYIFMTVVGEGAGDGAKIK